MSSDSTALHPLTWLLDQSGSMTDISPAAQHFFGWNSDKATVPLFTEFLLETDSAEIFSRINEVLEGNPGQVELSIKNNVGDYVPMELCMVPQYIDGEIAGVYILAKDLSERRQIELELKRSNEELQHFAYIASHDLQEPLRMISSYLKLIERRYTGKLDKDADEFIAFAVDGATRLQNMINGLLEFSRVETRGKPFAPVNLEEVLENSLANLEMAIEESDVHITHTSLPTVKGDSGQLTSLLQNLLSNAIKFRKQGMPLTIHIAAEKLEDGWRFSVHDNGIGIDPEYRDQIFTIFTRLNPRSEYPGTGIGLTVCKRIVERHGGEIWVESNPGEGSTFYFTLPASNP